MSILLSSEDGWIICHEKYINKMYKNVKNNNAIVRLKFNNTLFNINSKFLRQNQVKSLKNNDTKNRKVKKKKESCVNEQINEVHIVKNIYKNLIHEAKEQKLFLDTVKCDNNEEARSTSQMIFNNVFYNAGNSHGYNSSHTSIISKIQSEEFVFPERSYFYCYDIKDFNKKNIINKKFDFLVMDPPWWNKSVRRKKAKLATDSYSMMYNEDLVKIPVQKLLKPNGIVAVWCTTSSSNLNSILNEMFPAWGVIFKAKWYWIKVTKSGETICDFNETQGKQPFELLVIGSKSIMTDIPSKKVILSIPSAIHSHKPPLTDIFATYLPKNPTCLEIFARYLLPSWSSWGLEVLKFQHLSLYAIEKNMEEIC